MRSGPARGGGDVNGRVIIVSNRLPVTLRTVANGVLRPIGHDRIDRLPLRIEGGDVYEGLAVITREVVH